MSKNLFVLGTGTDIGKTYVSALLVRALREAGLNAGYFKPVSSGNLRENDGSLVPLDVKFVREFAGLNLSYEQMSAFNYERAYSPHLAAKFEGNAPQIQAIQAKFNELSAKCDFIVIEGAGGVVCPLSYEPTLMQTDVVRELGCPVLLVANSALGAINAAVTAFMHLSRLENLRVTGVILNDFDASDLVHMDNKFMIEQMLQTRVLDVVARGQTRLNLSAEKLAELFE